MELIVSTFLGCLLLLGIAKGIGFIYQKLNIDPKYIVYLRKNFLKIFWGGFALYFVLWYLYLELKKIL